MNNKIQILIRILLIALPFVAPWWLVLIFVLAGLFLFDGFYEIILIGFICDILYSSMYTHIGLYGFTLISCLLFVIVKQIKQRLILY